ncbi:methionine/alanine import family NSS transporter small subunit [Nocardioides campestrisoli]|nr:methionine/alanine import family NSS transporter small subunit [Nocardioides campestrisoli]
MNGDAIVMMVVAMLILWGGLLVAIIRLTRSPDVPRTDELHRDL